MQKGSIFTIICLLFAFELTCAQLSFPQLHALDKKKENSAGRQPLYSPTRCKHNELLYPGDQVDDWICDCEPAAIYHPEEDACFAAFRKGPCKKGQMLVLAPGAIMPECIDNVCGVDGQVQINKVCYAFGSGKPCPNAELTYVVGVNASTLMIDCVKEDPTILLRLLTEEGSTIEHCARGTKRSYKGECPTAT